MAWRAPSMNELFIGGLHHSTATIEIGREDLKAEQSYNFSTGFSFDYSFIKAEASVYSHIIQNYIYSLPDTNPMLTIRGYFPVFRYTQTNAAISGSDIDVSVFPIRNIQLGGKASLIWARNLKTNDWLEQIPSHRFIYSARYNFDAVGKVDGLYIGFNVLHVLRQNLLPKYNIDFAPAPDAYWLLNFDAGTNFRVRDQKFSISFSINNMLDKSYRDYMNRFRYFTDEAGINVLIRLKAPLYFH
jgi:iron complex outermembrane recepter protein